MKRVCFLLWVATLSAASYEAPWLGNPYELEAEIEGGGAYYKSICTSGGSITYHDAQQLARASLEGSLTDWQVVLEANGARTAKESFNFTAGSFLVRYNILNDVDGSSPFSLTAAVRGDFPQGKAISDPGLLYSYYCQGEAEISVGKEWAQGSYWDTRLWFLAALGSGTRYSPWIRGICAVEKNFCDTHVLSLFLRAQEGFGQSVFPGLNAFQSYGPLSYSFVDIQFRYAYEWASLASLSAEYTLRLAAFECPANRQAVTLTLNIPFSIV